MVDNTGGTVRGPIGSIRPDRSMIVSSLSLEVEHSSQQLSLHAFSHLHRKMQKTAPKMANEKPTMTLEKNL